MSKSIKKPNPLYKSLRLAALIILGVIVYAYGFQVTQVNFDEINSPRRQESLTRVIRALFHPEILEYDQVETQVNAPFYTPCPSQPVDLPEPDQDGAYLVVKPECSEPRTQITIEGHNLIPNQRGQVYFIPPSEVTLGLGTYETDGSGEFQITARVPPRPSDQVQYIRTVYTRNVGKPRLSQTAIDTWDKIIETVFLALLATTFGIIFAVPISFLAARNIMRDITLPMSSLSLTILGWPLGIALGGRVAVWIGIQSQLLTDNLLISLIGIAVSIGLIWVLARFALPQEEEKEPGLLVRFARIIGMIAAALLVILVLFLIASLAIRAGEAFLKQPGLVGMLASFLMNLGEILELMIAIVAALAGGGVLSNTFSRLGRNYIYPLEKTPRLIVNLILGGLAGATVGVLIGAGLDWIYQISNPAVTFWLPGAVGAALGVVTVISNRSKDKLPIGLTIYYFTRTILNGLRAIEALIWVIIFVVWVGIGPFAGMLALALHTIATLGKLYSEQVESIMPGPLEAVKATGATRIQVIIYSVVPQIIPLYISFSMYRWDINVRMSTIVGFAGGGGIGFLLLQNINLLNYRAASTQMLAIAIVVALMDYLSSYMRERIV
jgi:phosphonate ABC transporter permease subunit PhnE